jgi:hypothetical protein
MNHVTAPSLRRLRRGQVLRLPRPHGWCLRAERGTAWLTIDGQPEDITLDSGESHRIAAHERALVTALGDDLVLSLVPPARAPGWRAWWAALLWRPAVRVGPA